LERFVALAIKVEMICLTLSLASAAGWGLINYYDSG
jgi:hypothetical protein